VDLSVWWVAITPIATLWVEKLTALTFAPFARFFFFGNT